MLAGAAQAAVEWIGERLLFWIDDSEALSVATRNQDPGAIFRVPIVLGIEVKNPVGLATMLVAVQAMLRTSAPDMLVFEPTERYRDRTFTRIRLSAQGQQMGPGGLSDAALYYGSVGGFFYISTSLKSLHSIVDSLPAAAPATEAAAAPASQAVAAGTMPAAPATRPAAMGHFALRLNLADARHAKAVAEFYLAQAAQLAEAAHRQNLLLVAQTVGLGEKSAATPQRVLGYSIKSALGNTYRYDAGHGEVVGSVTGSQWGPARPPTISDDSPLGRLVSGIRSLSANLAFTEDGLRSALRIERK
jgi:hypothetical protein